MDSSKKFRIKFFYCSFLLFLIKIRSFIGSVISLLQLNFIAFLLYLYTLHLHFAHLRSSRWQKHDATGSFLIVRPDIFLKSNKIRKLHKYLNATSGWGDSHNRSTRRCSRSRRSRCRCFSRLRCRCLEVKLVVYIGFTTTILTVESLILLHHHLTLLRLLILSFFGSLFFWHFLKHRFRYIYPSFRTIFLSYGLLITSLIVSAPPPLSQYVPILSYHPFTHLLSTKYSYRRKYCSIRSPLYNTLTSTIGGFLTTTTMMMIVACSRLFILYWLMIRNLYLHKNRLGCILSIS